MVEPKIRFSGFIGQWKQRKLGNLLILSNERNDGSYSRNDVLAAALGTELQKKQIFFGLKATDDSVKNYRVVKSGDVIYTKSPIKGFPNGIVRISKGVNGIVPSLYCVYHCSDSVVPSFIQLYFEDKTRLDAYLEPLVNVGARNNVNITDSGFLEGEICLPETVEEQQNIVDFLSSVDDVIAASEAEVHNLETQKKAMMKKIFSQEVRFKKDDGTDFPEWEEKQMKEVITLLSGQDFPPEQYNDQGIGTPYLTGASCIANDKTTAVRWTETPKNIVVLGDIVIVCKGSGSGTVAIVDQEKAHIARQFMSIRPTQQLEKSYCYHRVCGMTEEIRSEARGTIPGIERNTILHRTIGVPCLEEQRLIADFLSDFDDAIAAAKKEMELWKELKKGLLQQMFV